ncbi:MAG TPA: helix-turn-helix domain-containing protein [Telluria sp.]
MYEELEALSHIQGTRPVLEQIANKWSVLILTVLCERPARFNVVKRRLDPITHKALTEALRRLERNGLVHRRVIPTSQVGVEYSITPLGQSLREPFLALIAWAGSHGAGIAHAQEAYDARPADQSGFLALSDGSAISSPPPV